MQYAVITAGAIVGWIFVELAVVSIGQKCPTPFNIGMAFVGGVVAKLIYGA